MNLDMNAVQVLSARYGSHEFTFSVEGNQKVTIQMEINLLQQQEIKRRLKEELDMIFTFLKNKRKDWDPSERAQLLRREAIFLTDFDRKYGPENDGGTVYWIGNLNDGRNRGGKPYFCPIGWKRFTLKVQDLNTGDKFGQKYDNWHIAYHGTKFKFGISILLGGLKAATIDVLGPGAYLSPSINYAAHFRYSEIGQLPPECAAILKTNSAKWVQFVLQVRVNPDALQEGIIGPETLIKSNLKLRNIVIDPNISNNEIEWVIQGKKFWNFADPNSDIICSGLMVRYTDENPQHLKESKWWVHTDSWDFREFPGKVTSTQQLAQTNATYVFQ